MAERIEINELLAALCAKLRANYIFPEVAAEIVANLESHAQAGEYAEIDEGELLALALTMHLQEVNHDEHLWVRWHAEPLPEEDDQLRLNPEWQAARRMEAALDNHGVHKLEQLAGNVGYLDLRYLHRPEWGGETVAAALSCLAATNALILDLRQCGGGYPGMAALVCSYFLEERPRLISSIYWRDDDTTQQFWTLPVVPGRRYGNKPLFALIGKGTFSAGELLAHVLQSQGRATLIGEQTDGGAHPGASYRLTPHFEAFIPIGRMIDPQGGGDWEGKGITPDAPVAAKQALETAHSLALRAILEQAPPPANEVEVAYLDEMRELLAKM
jgi:C-terminal processing protease CtpA/Prc